MAGRSHRMWGAVLAVATLLGGLVATGAPAHGVVATVTSGIVRLSTPPADVRPAGVCSPTQGFAFDELQGVTLGADQKVDFTTPGSYSAYPPGSFVPRVPAGTVVDSHFVDFNGKCGVTWREGTVTFAQDIVGVIVQRDRLNNSDYLGSPTTEYGGAYPSREFEWAGDYPDFVRIDNARTIYVKSHAGGNTDQMRVLTKHNEPPVPNAGGPYAGNEGSNVTLSGSVTDPDGDPVTKSWTFVKSASAGTTCTYTNTTTLTPTVNCNDDALVTATLSVNDGFHTPVTSVANVTISNRPPTITSVTVPSGPIALGATANLSAVFADAGSHDTHGTSTVAWGDTLSSTPTVNEPGHTLSTSHVYGAAGTYTVTVTVNDDDGGTVSNSLTTITVVGPPLAGAGGDKSVHEGTLLNLMGAASSSLPTTKTWTFAPGPYDPGTNCTYTGTNTLTPSVQCNDDLVIAAQLTVDDGVNAPVSDSSTITIENEAPVLSPLTATADPIKVGDPVTVSGAFTDAGTNDTHTSTADWGDMTSSGATVTESLGAGTTSATHTYLTPGLYTVSVDVNDGDGGIATRTIQIRVNTPPTADAGGPYAGPEGTLLTLGGSASDPDPDVLTYGWTFVVTGAPPSACTFGATTTLAPTVLCTDNASIAATLSVSDGVNTPVTSLATVLVGNVAPTLGSVTVPGSPVSLTTLVSASVPFTDAGTSDTHTATIDWGDSTSSTATVTESSGAGTASGTHTYSAPGSYTISITVTDDDGDPSTATASAVVVNGPPTVSAGGPYLGNEGSVVTLSGSASDPEGDTLTRSWSFTSVGDAGRTCTPAGTGTLTPTVTCNDNAVVTATLTASDGINAPVVSIATVTFGNVAPVVGALVAAPSIQAVGAGVSVSAGFTDVGTNDTHSVLVDWGDTTSSAGSVTESAGAGTATGSHTYTDAGIYTVSMTVTDDNTGSATVSTNVVVYDPSGPFVTASGKFASPSGAYTPDNPSDPNVVGTAQMQFVAKYHTGDTVPTGNGSFRFEAAGLDLDATGFVWLVVTDAGDEAFFRGTGTVNGISGYEFLVSGIDGSPDLVRIKVWQTSTGTVVYDSQPGAADDADPITPLNSGQFIVH